MRGVDRDVSRALKILANNPEWDVVMKELKRLQNQSTLRAGQATEQVSALLGSGRAAGQAEMIQHIQQLEAED
jgi:hypothetical protein